MPNITKGSSRDDVLNSVSQDGSDLINASDEFKSDPEIVLAAVKKNRESLQYATERLKSNEQFIAMLLLETDVGKTELQGFTSVLNDVGQENVDMIKDLKEALKVERAAILEHGYDKSRIDTFVEKFFLDYFRYNSIIPEGWLSRLRPGAPEDPTYRRRFDLLKGVNNNPLLVLAAQSMGELPADTDSQVKACKNMNEVKGLVQDQFLQLTKELIEIERDEHDPTMDMDELGDIGRYGTYEELKSDIDEFIQKELSANDDDEESNSHGF